MSDDYLFDGDGPVDLEVAGLERLLQPYRYRRRRRRWQIVAALVAAALIVGGDEAAVAATRPSQPTPTTSTESPPLTPPPLLPANDGTERRIFHLLFDHPFLGIGVHFLAPKRGCQGSEQARRGEQEARPLETEATREVHRTSLTRPRKKARAGGATA